MKLRKNERRRAAYTLLELLIVVAIIILLAALLVSGVQQVLRLGTRTEALHEIKKLEQSLQVAMTKYNNVMYLPSQLILYNNPANYTSDSTPLGKQSANVMRAMFGKRFLTNGVTQTWAGPGANASITLNGPECLVFYLGGNTFNGKTGFSTDPTNPTSNAGNDRLGPFYDFRSNRLVVQSGRTLAVYVDPYGGQPYVYFAATGKNDYSLAGNYSGLNPYFEQGTTPPRFLNPNTFQIISAGRDRAFGPGGAIDLTNGVYDALGADNLSNFSSSELGNPVQ